MRGSEYPLHSPLVKYIRCIPLVANALVPLCNPILCGLLAKQDLAHRRLDFFSHMSRATHKHPSAPFPQTLHLSTVIPQPILDIFAPTSLRIVRFDTAERSPYINRALRLPLIKLFTVEIVHLRPAAPKEEQHRGDLEPIGQQRGAFLDKPAERGKTGAGSHADDGRIV